MSRSSIRTDSQQSMSGKTGRGEEFENFYPEPNPHGNTSLLVRKGTYIHKKHTHT
jgi:hypothetical protein